ncbi:hypothetical protein RB195_010047 [Necator americanus]|uniref:Uncharacterized protein n=1 Tax=Necator americanus TaxID=51031 RepID=A0ABR1CXJ7_NECAM
MVIAHSAVFARSRPDRPLLIDSFASSSTHQRAELASASHLYGCSAKYMVSEEPWSSLLKHHWCPPHGLPWH